jgi:hypothetical protein
MHFKISKNLRIPNLLLFFLQLRRLLSDLQFCYFLLIQYCKTYVRTMLPPVGRNWQLIYPNYLGDLLIFISRCHVSTSQH